MFKKINLPGRKNLHFFSAIFLSLFFIFSISQTVFALPNPAAVYCQKLGYEYKVIKTPEGEKGVCVVPGNFEFDAWEFFRGKVGKEYSYCAKQGYDTESERKDQDGYFAECAVCVSKSKSSDGKAAERIPMLELMEKNGEPLLKLDSNEMDVNKGGSECKECQKQEEKSDTCPNIEGKENKQGSTQKSITYPKAALPTSFDWRSYSGHAYIGDIRDQGGCGSCYAFGAAASAEGVYNYAMGLFDGARAEFSESFIMWCLGRVPAYSSHFYGCYGADYDYMELEALTTYGICSLADFPYTTVDPGSCTHWSDPLIVFSEWGRIDCGDTEAIQTAIMTYGPVDVAVAVDMYVGQNFAAYTTGVYEDSVTTCPSTPCYYSPVNHAVALVGWDDTPPEGGGGVWILRNSWGTAWGEGGYMRIRYTSARVACEATYLQIDSPSSEGRVWLDGNSYSAPDVVNVTVWDSDLTDTATVEFTSVPTNDTEIVTLTETGSSTGVFAGSINLAVADASVGDGTLQVHDYDIITVTYNDADDGTGNPATVTDIAEVVLVRTPTGLTATAGRNYVFLYWNTVQSPALAGYNVYRSTSSVGTKTKVNGGRLVKSNSYADGSLFINTTYYYWVSAEDIYGDETDYSSYIVITTTGAGGDEDGNGDGDGGNGGSGSSGPGSLSGCFIATASYGTPMAEEVKVLSNFRDEYLMTNSLGRFFVSAYYRTSPPIASFISEHPYLKGLVRGCLKPVVKFADKVVER